jgi:hypothetical protein
VIVAATMMGTKDGGVSTLTFGLFPERTLRVSLHFVNDVTPLLVASSSSTSSGGGDKFAICRANRVISLQHVAVAANAALLRRRQRDASVPNKQSAAMETILCLAGSTNTSSIFQDYTFVVNNHNNNDTNNPPPTDKPCAILVLGFDCADTDEYHSFLQTTGLTKEPPTCPETYFERERTQDETNDLMKVYKLSKQEIDMSSLEEAVLTRVATKYFI